MLLAGNGKREDKEKGTGDRREEQEEGTQGLVPVDDDTIHIDCKI